MKHLAYLCGEYPRTTDTFIQREIAGLRSMGFHVETISVRHPVIREQGTYEQADERLRTFYLLPCSPFRLARDHLCMICSSPVRYFNALKLAVKVRSPGVRSLIYQIFYFAEAGMVAARMHRQGMVHIHNHSPDAAGYVTMIAACMGGFSYSITLHGFGIFSEPGRWRLREKIERSLFTICISRHGVSQAMLFSDRKHWGKIHLVHCGVQPPATAVPHHKGRGKSVLFAGRIDYVKGLPILINGFSILAKKDPDVHLHIVGDGPGRQDFELMIDELVLHTRITMYGYLSQEELKKLYEEADVFVITSFFEGIPVVLMEAMSYGVPVVAPGITGIPELVQDGVGGKLVLPADPESLADAIDSLLASPEKRNMIATAGREKIEKEFNLVTEIDRFSGILQRYLH